MGSIRTRLEQTSTLHPVFWFNAQKLTRKNAGPQFSPSPRLPLLHLNDASQQEDRNPYYLLPECMHPYVTPPPSPKLSIPLNRGLHTDELVMWCIFKKLRGYLLFMQMLQLPLVSLSRTRWLKGKATLGNLLFWIGIFTGPSLLCSLYLII